jgi:hypothetical protein
MRRTAGEPVTAVSAVARWSADRTRAPCSTASGSPFVTVRPCRPVAPWPDDPPVPNKERPHRAPDTSPCRRARSDQLRVELVRGRARDTDVALHRGGTDPEPGRQRGVGSAFAAAQHQQRLRTKTPMRGEVPPRRAAPHEHPAVADLARRGPAQRPEQTSAYLVAPAAAGVTPNAAALARSTRHSSLAAGPPVSTTRPTTNPTRDPDARATDARENPRWGYRSIHGELVASAISWPPRLCGRF